MEYNPVSTPLSLYSLESASFKNVGEKSISFYDEIFASSSRNEAQSTPFYGDGGLGIIRPASTPILPSTNSFHGVFFGNYDSNSHIPDFNQPYTLFNSSSAMNQSSQLLSSRSVASLESLYSTDKIPLNDTNASRNSGFVVPPYTSQSTSANTSSLGATNDFTFSHGFDSDSKASNRSVNLGRNSMNNGPNSNYHAQHANFPSHNPRQVHHPIFRSNVNIQAINNYRHSAAPSLGVMGKQTGHFGSHHHYYHNNKDGNTAPAADMDPAAIENLITITCKNILKDASSRALKAVELANTLRARVGTDILAFVRENWGGLLSLLEKHPKLFRVDRIPKNDMVTLCDELSSKSAGGTSHDQGNLPVEDSTSSNVSGFPSFNDMNSRPSNSNLSDNFGIHSSDQSSDLTSYVSKCLHVGNVPTNLAEKDLVKEFEKYGAIESVKLINQRGRRFAFICFRTIEMAVNAKFALSRLHPWKSAISFAHRDYVNNNSQSYNDGEWRETQTPYNRSSGTMHRSNSNSSGYGYISTKSENSQISPNRSSASSPFPGAPNRTYTPPPQVQSFAPTRSMSHQYLQSQGAQRIGESQFSNDPMGAPNFRRTQSYVVGDNHQNYYGYSDNSSMNHYNSNDNGPFYRQDSDNSSWSQIPGLDSFQGGGYNVPSPPPNHVIGQVSFNPGILRRLCDDTYVPTQTWPVDLNEDSPFCDAIIAQLCQFGGSTSISKLRGFLRTRINASDNIKSVPLKALLAAYPQYFHLHNNQVALLENSSKPFQPQYHFVGHAGHGELSTLDGMRPVGEMPSESFETIYHSESGTHNDYGFPSPESMSSLGALNASVGDPSGFYDPRHLINGALMDVGSSFIPNYDESPLIDPTAGHLSVYPWEQGK